MLNYLMYHIYLIYHLQRSVILLKVHYVESRVYYNNVDAAIKFYSYSMGLISI